MIDNNINEFKTGNVNEFKTGDIILFYLPFKWNSPMSWLAYLIRLFAKSKYNHAGVVIKYYNIAYLNEAIKSGVVSRILPDRLIGAKYLVLRVKNDFNEIEFIKRANSKIGTKYDYKSLFIYQLIYQLFGVWIGKKGEKANNRMYCYEYVAFCHKIENSYKSEPKFFEKDNDYFYVSKCST